MTVVTKKYARKALVVEAVQVTEENFADVALWCGGERVNNDGTPTTDAVNPAGEYIKVDAHNPRSNRQTKALVGDWLLKSDLGFKIYPDRAFVTSFDPVPEPAAAMPLDPVLITEPQESVDAKLEYPDGGIPEVGETPVEAAEAAAHEDMLESVHAGGQHVFRDAVSGEFVDEEYARANPNTTVKEWVEDEVVRTPMPETDGLQQPTQGE